ncbi:SWIM zinc finger family protein [Streptomyces rishiriensis]|uniref:SWIM zinc finger family protein n=1 Tax=Streptomyces rishiriensis TaxID=68264 RepID=UPI0027D947B7|nr:SWIM zinc finger family protein [Streptomyces rishiriensis]
MTEREGEPREPYGAPADGVTDEPVTEAADAEETATGGPVADGMSADGIGADEGRQEPGSSPADEVRRALRAARERRQDPPPGRPLKHPQRQWPRTPSTRQRTPEQPQGRQAEPGARRPADEPSPQTLARADRSTGGSATSPADAARAALRRTPSTPAAPAASPTAATPSAVEASPAADSHSATAAEPEHTAPELTAPELTAPELTAPEAGSPYDPPTPHVPPTPDVPTGPRPGDVAREALRAARAQARRDSAGTGERAGRESERNGPRAPRRPHPEPRLPGDRLQSRAPDPVAGERARAVRDLLAGAFRMPADGTTGPDADPLTAPEPNLATPAALEETPRPATDRPATSPAPETRTPSPAAEASADGPDTRASAAPPVTEPTAPSPTAPSPTAASATAASATAASATAASPAAVEGRAGATARGVEATRAPRSMAAPSRDGDHRRTFPPFPPRTGAAFAETWWGNAWVAALEEGALDLKRLVRGRGYAEQGNVDAITVTPGLVLAYVQGSRPRPYRVQVRLRTLGGEDWERFLDAAVERPGHIAALIDKEMPESLADCGVPLLPGPGDLEPQCSCPDRGHPCKHAAALCYQTARLLDADPFVLLLLRGRGEREVLDALSRRNAVRAARAAQEQEQQPEPLAGVRAAEALAERRLPPLPAPLPVPAHPEQPPAYPSAPHGPDSFALDHLATDAAARAHALLATGHDEIGALTLWQDAVRLAASRPGSGLTAATRSLYASLASAAGRTPSELARAVAAWRQGGPDGLTVLEECWDPPAGRFDRARPLLLAADLPAFRPRRNHLTHPRGHVQLRYGQDGLWYAYESEPGHDDWWPRGTPDSDPVGALTGLGVSDEL